MTIINGPEIPAGALPVGQRIGFRLLVLITVVIGLLAVVTMVIRYRALDRENRQDIDARLVEIGFSHVPALTESLWTMNEAALAIDLKSLVDLPEIDYARIIDPAGGMVKESGTRNDSEAVTRDYPLVHVHNNYPHRLGVLHVEASLRPGREKAREALAYEIVSFFVLLMVLASLLLIGIRLLITKPLEVFAARTRRVAADQLGQPLTIPRTRLFGQRPDELDLVVAGFNDMQRNLATAYQQLQAANMALSEDVARRRQAETALLQAKGDLEERVRERTAELTRTHEQLLHAEKLSAAGKMAASVAHEFNNPLYGIRNVLKGIDRRVSLEAEDRDLVGLAIRECDRMKDLIASLQKFNRPTSGEFSRIDLHKTIAEIIQFCKEEFNSRGVEIDTRFSDVVLEIEAIEDQIKQVILNLLNNAEEAVENNIGRILVSTRRHQGNVLISIEDNGSGIRKENLSHVFEPFFSTKPAVKGTGLGLSVSYGIIKRHGGTITVTSQPGQGSVFTVILPVRQEAKHEQGSDIAG